MQDLALALINKEKAKKVKKPNIQEKLVDLGPTLITAPVPTPRPRPRPVVKKKTDEDIVTSDSDKGFYTFKDVDKDSEISRSPAIESDLKQTTQPEVMETTKDGSPYMRATYPDPIDVSGTFGQGRPDLVAAYRPTSAGMQQSMKDFLGRMEQRKKDSENEALVSMAIAGLGEILSGSTTQGEVAELGQQLGQQALARGREDEKRAEDFLNKFHLEDYKRQLGDPLKILEQLKKDKKIGRDEEHRLRQQFMQSKDFRTYQDQAFHFAKLKALMKGPHDAARDLLITFSIMKMFDPTSMVSLSEAANVQNAAGTPEKLRNLYNRILEGAKLTPTGAINLFRRAEDAMKASTERINSRAIAFRKFALKDELRPEQVAPFEKATGQTQVKKGMVIKDGKKLKVYKLVFPDGSVNYVRRV